MPQVPNVVLCMCDQLRAFEVGCYGNAVIRTPHIDSLAAQGVRFSTAVTNYPVCMAARSVTLSGQYNRTCTGGVGNVATSQGAGRVYFPQYPFAGRPHLQETTLPEILRESGYHTAAIGKWHIHSWPNDVGFDTYVIPRVNHCHVGQSFTENGGPELVPEGYSVDYECERVEHYIGQRARTGQPFFLFYNISPPHCPMSEAPDKYLHMYRPEDIPIRPNVDLERRLPDQDHWFKVYRWDYRYYNHHLPYTEILPDDFTLRRVISEYYGMTTWVDDAVGRMLAALEMNGLAGDTIVIFTSDHGDYLGSHSRVQKGDLHEESVRIPLIVRWPAQVGGGWVAGAVASLVDLAPTVLDLCGAAAPVHMNGQSLAPILRGEYRAPSHDCAFIETGQGAGIRTKNALYGLPYAPGTHGLADAPVHFYDLERDPFQLHNLAGTDEHADIAAELDKRLRDWDARTRWMAG